MYSCQMKDCFYWDKIEEICLDDEVFIDTETGEPCCRYYDGAMNEEDYQEWYDEYENEMWDDTN
jgi:hypothetical protein